MHPRDQVCTSRRRVTVIDVSDSESGLEDPGPQLTIHNGHALRRDDLPPSYEAEYYFRGDVESFAFSRVVKTFLNSLCLTTNQCARVEAVLSTLR